jgi:hypothetical protein
MIRRPVLRAILPRQCQAFAGFKSSVIISAGQPNTRLSLDPSLQSLLKDVDMSLINLKIQHPPPRELEVIPADTALNEVVEIDETHDPFVENRQRRRSPAAHFGSQQIGSVVIPLELQRSINHLIAG